MNTSIGAHEYYALVSPQDFTDRMTLHWSQRLQLITSPALRTLWGIMADTFRKATINSINGVVASPWLILQPPTGSGKTQGACVFAAMQAGANAQGSLKPVGVLIVTRLIEQADIIAATINELAGRVVAVAHHSDKPATPQELRDSDILIITHQAYVNAPGNNTARKDALRSRFTAWRGGTRLLTIIDEALANVVENNKVTVANLAQVISYVTPEIRHEFPEQLKVLEELHSILVSHANPEGRTETHSIRMLWDDDTSVVQMPDMAALQLAMKPLPYDTLVLNEHSDSSRERIWRKVRDIIAQSAAVMEQWAYYAQKGKEHSINSASFLIPWNVPGPVVLDATANANFLWDLFGPMAQIVPTPTKVRDYSTVTLHLARATGVGKTTMVKNIKTRFPRLLHALESEIGPDRSVFLCMHKDTEHVALSYDHHFARFDVGHWGAVDGRNDWDTFDTAVIFGLSYREQIWSTNLFFALQGYQDDEWLQSPVWKEHENVRAVMEQRQLSVSTIQAINRVCCRRVIDAQGRCPSADIYVVLPKDKTGDAILQDILADMPNIRVVPWAFELDGPKVRKARTGTSHAALITLMSNRLPGETALPHIQRELGLDRLKLKKLKEALSKSDHHTTTALRNIGVGYVVRGAGRGAKSFLIKDQAA
jgi:hypothetical protein